MTKALTILLGCLALAATVHAHPGAHGKDGKQGDTPADLLAKYDKNGDGKLDESELTALTSEDRAALDRHRRHHGHPGRGDGDGRGKGGPGGKGDGRGDDAGRGKGGPGKGGSSGPGGKGAPSGKGDGRGDDAGRGKDNGRGNDKGHGNDSGRGKGKAI